MANQCLAMSFLGFSGVLHRSTFGQTLRRGLHLKRLLNLAFGIFEKEQTI
jgi:hypothetical protein